jgi:hypothetical protein
MMHGFWLGFLCGVCSIISVAGVAIWLLVPWEGGAGFSPEDLDE